MTIYVLSLLSKSSYSHVQFADYVDWPQVLELATRELGRRIVCCDEAKQWRWTLCAVSALLLAGHLWGCLAEDVHRWVGCAGAGRRWYRHGRLATTLMALRAVSYACRHRPALALAALRPLPRHVSSAALRLSAAPGRSAFAAALDVCTLPWRGFREAGVKQVLVVYLRSYMLISVTMPD